MKEKTITEIAKEIHDNAKAHGWWDEPRTRDEIHSLIHSEWSEALEEYRAGRPMIWHHCEAGAQAHEPSICENNTECFTKTATASGQVCADMNPKPEGIAVELIDGVIRILDYYGKMGSDIEEIEIYPVKDTKLPFVVAELHSLTAASYQDAELADAEGVAMDAVHLVFSWLSDKGVDPWQVMEIKHEYNKTRPYKHGGKVI